MVSPEADATIAAYAAHRLAATEPSRTWEELRSMSAQMSALQPPAEGVEIDEIEAGGVPVERTRATDAEPDRHIVYVHGGGYVCGSAGGQRAFLAALARAAGAAVHSVDYRLAPEHPCPAAIDDVVAATVAIQSLADARPVFLGGDSAGGGLAIAAVLEMRERGFDLPAGVFALSPWADMTLAGAAHVELADRDVMVRRNDLAMMRDCYLAGQDPAGRHASPALADLTGLPPLHVQVGGEEVLLGDAHLLIEAARSHGVRATLHVADGMFHTWQVLAPALPESEDALASLAQFVTTT